MLQLQYDISMHQAFIHPGTSYLQV